MSHIEKVLVCPSLDLESTAAIVGAFTFADGTGFVRHIEKKLVKKALNLLGFSVGGLRKPLTEMEPDNVKKLVATLKGCGFAVTE